MTEQEQEKLSAELERLWPKKYQDAELIDWCNRMNRYRLPDILAALDACKNSKRWAPQVSEVLAMLRGKEIGDDGGSRNDSLADAIAKSDDQLSKCHPWERLLRYWRKVWFQYKLDADRRRAKAPNNARAKAAAELHERQEAGMRHRVEVSCASSLCTEGMDLDLAERFAAALTLDAADFRFVLDDLRNNIPVQGQTTVNAV